MSPKYTKGHIEIRLTHPLARFEWHMLYPSHSKMKHLDRYVLTVKSKDVDEVPGLHMAQPLHVVQYLVISAFESRIVREGLHGVSHQGFMGVGDSVTYGIDG